MTSIMRAPSGVAALFVLLSSGLASAQSTEAAATALFDDGRKLMAQHKYAEACPKLAESQRLAPSGGTLINLADCYEHEGRKASAWVAWKNVAARANAAGRAQEESKAVARAAALEPTLARLAVSVAPESDQPGLEVERDGVVVGRAEFGLAIPVDPGTHEIQATAPKMKAWSTRIDVRPGQTDARVTVALQADGEAAPPTGAAAPVVPPVQPTDLRVAPGGPAPDVSPEGGGSAQRTFGIVTLGAGVAGVAVGAVFGVLAMSKNNEALQPRNCPTSTLCTPNGLSLTSDAKNDATVSTIAFAAGAAALVGGVALWFTAPASAASPRAARIVPTLTGALIEGTW
jgi:hypothetical protein